MEEDLALKLKQLMLEEYEAGLIDENMSIAEWLVSHFSGGGEEE